ncbi:phospholipase D-like domain-containing protein [Candidatus Paracaedibacter symbiosus]|uniref:phospholipase D-like domain-containing protein n=1 Tax=Candidatus Paracaedibacter symbiosus TaxID=244582 RepID=UPI000509479F|nr:phospholipase D-like domain-containing protein [Candidatus Paracaedibacter symbiosus]
MGCLTIVALRFSIIIALFLKVLSPDGSTLWAMELHTAPSPFKKRARIYRGHSHSSLNIENVFVKPCISLGSSCTEKIADLIKESDEFVVVFMYRLDAPNIIHALTDKYLTNIKREEGTNFRVITFLDYEQSLGDKPYHSYIKELVDNVPTSLVKLGSKSFHHKVTISKKKGYQAVVTIGSANATYESDNVHSEDTLFIQSNELAKSLLDKFYSLFTMKGPREEHTIKIYHMNRVDSGVSNTEQLTKLDNFFNPDDQFQNIEGYSQANIRSLAISTGFAQNVKENNNCFEILENILVQKNNALFLFENFLTSTDFFKLLNESETPKLIVVDNDKTNRDVEDTIKNISHSASLLFTPYTKGKFHHKLIIQYPEEGNPVVYTGSFHPSTNAIKNNSELIIGIESEALASQYLSHILYQSGLGNQRTVWGFMYEKLPELFSPEGEITKIAQKINNRLHHNIQGYPERFYSILEKFPLKETKGNLQNKIEEEANKFGQLDNREKYNLLSFWAQDIFALLNTEPYRNVFFSKQQMVGRFLKVNQIGLSSTPEEFITKLGVWINEAKEKLEKYISEGNIDHLTEIKDNLSEIESIYVCLYYAFNYVDDFKSLAMLHDTLDRIIGGL